MMRYPNHKPEMPPRTPAHREYAERARSEKPRLHRAIKRDIDETDVFEHEARRHPEPGWDEKEDRWLDRFQ
jgi:hypothetical protein